LTSEPVDGRRASWTENRRSKKDRCILDKGGSAASGGSDVADGGSATQVTTAAADAKARAATIAAPRPAHRRRPTTASAIILSRRIRSPMTSRARTPSREKTRGMMRIEVRQIVGAHRTDEQQTQGELRAIFSNLSSHPSWWSQIVRIGVTKLGGQDAIFRSGGSHRNDRSGIPRHHQDPAFATAVR